MDGNRLVCGQN